MSQKVYVFTQIPNLVQCIRNEMPHVNVISVKVRGSDGEFKWNTPVSDEEISELSDAQILVSDNNLVEKVLYRLPNIKWIQCGWAGVERMIDVVRQHPNPPPFPVTRFSGSGFGHIMSEFVFSNIINHERRAFDDYVNMKIHNQWKKDVFRDYRTTNEITLAILGGCGAIGSYMAKFFHNIGTKVLGYGRTERTDEYIRAIPLDKYSTKLEDILPECDYIVSVLPSTNHTIGLLNGKLQLCAEKKPVLMNIGRGSLISESEIIKALDKKWISGAILDVFEVEPLPRESLLWSRDDVHLTPHVAAITRPRDVAKLFEENYRRFLAAEPLINVIDWKEGY